MAKPPFGITAAILSSSGDIMRILGRWEGMSLAPAAPTLRRQNRIRTVHASVAIEGNSLAEEQVTALLDGKRVRGSAREILEVRNAIAVYDHATRFNPTSERHLLEAHGRLMAGLIDDAGRYRSRGVGVVHGSRVAHMAPPAKRVPGLIEDLLGWLGTDRETHPFVKAAVVHYELEFIHPFMDGNGRIGRLWHHVVLARWHPLFEVVPLESVIHERQADYYRVLGECDRAGDSTRFVEFCLDALHVALTGVIDEARPARATVEMRLDAARREFGRRAFSRKDYIALLKTVSTATASRDLGQGVRKRLLVKTGTKALARYRFR